MSETTLKHKAEAPKNLNFAVITCSTSRYKEYIETGRLNDETGDIIVKVLKDNGHKVTMRKIVSDDREQIQKAVMRALKSRKVDVIITSGGTGLSPKDVTIEALRHLFEKEIPGFGEIFRMLSYREIGSAAIITRAIAGVAMGKAVFCLPGSPQSALLALKEVILPEVGHIIKHVRE
ncbi:MAG: MogA/MoaB family molybdenum cofactor biosynthesis protein [Candidatus Bathyarchaeia archaeon]|nr:MogA/MoaB family molybdenum cofactor biosynthesis protein [Candidatus Bathyarchaeota archaeon]